MKIRKKQVKLFRDEWNTVKNKTVANSAEKQANKWLKNFEENDDAVVNNISFDVGLYGDDVPFTTIMIEYEESVEL